jgi:OOP family OmpA-OmpF porin
MNAKAIFIAAFCAATVSGPAYAQDIESASDHPAIGRYEGTEITRFETLEYGSQHMLTSVDPEDYADFEGMVTRIVYALPDDTSVLQVVRSYEQKLTGEGFDVLVSCRDRNCGSGNLMRLRETVWRQLLNNEKAILTVERETDTETLHAQITVAPGWVNVNVVEAAAFENKVIDAAAMAESISETGRVSLDNIYFDFNEATLTAESDAALTEMARLLADNSGIDVYIVGHTDNVGGYEFNLDLSRRRAQAVVDVLVSQHGVDPARVVPAGVGPLAPIASNATDEGQAQNRRVELVQR